MKGEIENGAVYPSLKGRVTFITGGASGIGESLVEHFCAQGARVTFVDIAAEAGQALTERIKAKGHAAPRFIRCDLKQIDQLRAAIDETAKRDGPIRALLSNAGNDDRHRSEDVTVEYWDDRMAVNLRHVYFACQAVVPQMIELGYGSIINMSSLAWMFGTPDLQAYSAAKAAIVGLTNSLARQMGAHRIRVNAIAPGLVLTEKQRRLWFSDEAKLAAVLSRQSLPDAIQPEDIARVALFLAADDSRMITKHTFNVNPLWQAHWKK